MELIAKNVSKIFVGCLFKEDEEKINYVMAKGITITVGFHPKRLKQQKENIHNMLLQLPDSFIGGGGWSFLKMSLTKDNDIWTGLQQIMEQLLLLGLAIKKIEYCLPRSMWSSLPGGVPYLRISK